MLAENKNLILKDRLTPNDINDIVQKWDLDPSIFDHPNSPVEVARFIPLDSSELTNGHLLVTFSLREINASIEQELVPVFIIFDQGHLFIGTVAPFIDFHPTTNDIIALIFKNLLWQINHINSKLNHIKERIDALDHAARETTKTKELKKVTDLTRELVFLEHTLNNQTKVLQKFGNYLEENSLVSEAQVESLMTRQLRITKMIHVYSDLLNSISGLFTAMMDSHLNHLMKYLDSAALVIALPALISGIWGMNVGGLPGKNDDHGFWILIILGSLLTIGWSFYLKKKKYND